jgi:very-short-patch-repair endonuclease
MPKIITTSEFIKKSKIIHNDEYIYDQTHYISNNSEVIIICSTHGIFLQKPCVHLRGSGCNSCGIIKKSIDNKKCKDLFIIDSNKVHNNLYTYSKVDYINNKTEVIITCRQHGDFKQQPRSHIGNRSGCPTCANKNITTKIFIEKSILLYGNYYNYDKVNYINAIEKVKITCYKNHIFEISSNNHLRGRGCPICRESRGERIIRSILENKKIEFVRQFKFKDCKYKRTLPFDFYLPNKNICIEFDGEQHFKSFRFEIDEKGLNNRQMKDKIKDEYCLKNNIHLIRISYLDNIEDKLVFS